MMSLINKKPPYLRQSKKALTNLSIFLEFGYQAIVDELANSHSNPEIISSLHYALIDVATVRYKVEHLIKSLEAGEFLSTQRQLRNISKEVTTKLTKLPQDHIASRRYLTQALHQLIKAEEVLNKFLPTSIVYEEASKALEIVVPTDLLYQAFQSLFPAERMLVITGRSEKDKIALGVSFDVTGHSSTGHVQADPRRLAQALIAMTATNTHLAAWIHSHPGTGSIGTHPSSIDLNQHQDWLRDYSPNLLSAIFVKDRYFRFWGNAFETGKIRIQLIGDGVKKEKSDEPVYRLEPE